MEIKTMTIADIEERLSAIKSEIEVEGADLDALNTEVEELRSRKIEIIEEEASKAEERAKVADGSVGVVIKDMIKEEKNTMSELEVRNSVEYGKAFVNFIKTGKDDECRALLTTNASGTVPVPTALDTEIRNAWEECQIMSLVKKTSFKGIVKVGYEVSATGAAVHVEGSEAPEEETLVWGSVQLVPQNIKKWITVSDEAIEGTTVDTLAEIYKEVAQRIVEAAEAIAIQKITASALTQTHTASTMDVDTITNAVAELSGQAKNITLAMNRRTYAAFKGLAKKAHYGVDPFDGIKVVFTDALKAFSAASASDAYIIAGDFGYGFQANFPNGINDMTIKIDDLSLAEKDLVKIVGRQYVGMDVVAPKAFVKVVK